MSKAIDEREDAPFGVMVLASVITIGAIIAFAYVASVIWRAVTGVAA